MSSPKARWLILEAYYGGSHARLVDGLRSQLSDRVDFELLSLPARKWKWRMRGSALHFAREMAILRARDFDGVFVSSMCNAAELRGLVGADWSAKTWVVYFHENQLRYPVAHFDRRDHHFAFTNLVTARSADRLLFNSAYNRDSFCADLKSLLAKMPDARPDGLVDRLESRSEILEVPIDVASSEPRTRRGPCHIVWNHRWEFDKGPEALLRACQVAAGYPESQVKVSILGQSFRERPAAFDHIEALLGPRLLHFGALESRADYFDVLAGADVVLSTADHEFQGLAVLEAALHGAVPLVPDDLAYREIWPSEWRYARDDLARAMSDRIEKRSAWRKEDPVAIAQRFTWPAMTERWAGVFGGSGCAGVSNSGAEVE